METSLEVTFFTNTEVCHIYFLLYSWETIMFFFCFCKCHNFKTISILRVGKNILRLLNVLYIEFLLARLLYTVKPSGGYPAPHPYFILFFTVSINTGRLSQSSSSTTKGLEAKHSGQPWEVCGCLSGNQWQYEKEAHRKSPSSRSASSMEEQICNHYKYEYCKFKEDCQKLHVKGQCKDISSC